MPADPRARRRFLTTVAVCLAATVLVFTTASADTAEEIGRARALEADGRIDVAVEHLRAMLTDESRDPDPALLLELARLTDDPGEALALADEVLRDSRDDGIRARAHAMRGDYLYVAGQYELAAIEYAAAAERNAPEHQGLRHAASLLATGDIAGAIEIYDEITSSNSDDVAAWATIGRGRAHLAGGDTEKAVEELDRIAEELAGRPIRAHALTAAAEAAVAHGDIARARDLLLLLSAEFPGTYEATLAEDRVKVLDRRLAELDELAAETGDAEAEGAAPTETASPEQHAPEQEGE